LANYVSLAIAALIGYFLLKNKGSLGFGSGEGQHAGGESAHDKKSGGKGQGGHGGGGQGHKGSATGGHRIRRKRGIEGGSGNSSPAGDKATKSYAAAKGAKVTLRGKTRVLKAPKVVLIFWGNWAGGTPSTVQVSTQFRNLMASTFFNKLSQYGGGRPSYLGSVQATTAPKSGFTDAQIISAIGSMITAGKVLDMRKDNNVIYTLLPPKGVKAEDKEGDAYHTDFTWGGATANFITYYGSYDLPSMMKALSEEIAETIVDPWQTSNGDQIGDLCENTFTVNGVTVEGYWSNADNSCTGSAVVSNFARIDGGSNSSRILKTKALRAGYVRYGGFQ